MKLALFPRIEPPRSLTAVVTQTRPPATTGDDHPSPGTRVFHTTLRDSLHSNGTPRSVEWPWPVGPRNSGQSSARTANPLTNRRRMMTTRRRQTPLCLCDSVANVNRNTRYLLR